MTTTPVKTSAGTTLDFGQLEQLVISEGANPLFAPIWAGIALAESGGNPSAVYNTAYPNLPGYSQVLPGNSPEYSIGLWQINQVAHPQYNPQNLQTPEQQAQAAIAVGGNGATWSPWAGDPVGNAALQSNGQPLSASQVQSILSGAGRSTGSGPAGNLSGNPVPAGAQLTSFNAGSVASGLEGAVLDPAGESIGLFDKVTQTFGSDISNSAAFAFKWIEAAFFIAMVFVLGLTLILVGLTLLVLVLLGPVADPILAGFGLGKLTSAPKRVTRARAQTRPIKARSRLSAQQHRQRIEFENTRSQNRIIEREHRASAQRYGRDRGRTVEFDDSPF
jgi:hypothetical protein